MILVIILTFIIVAFAIHKTIGAYKILKKPKRYIVTTKKLEDYVYEHTIVDLYYGEEEEKSCDEYYINKRVDYLNKLEGFWN